MGREQYWGSEGVRVYPLTVQESTFLFKSLSSLAFYLNAIQFNHSRIKFWLFATVCFVKFYFIRYCLLHLKVSGDIYFFYL